jgi:hypothetical protein
VERSIILKGSSSASAPKFERTKNEKQEMWDIPEIYCYRDRLLGFIAFIALHVVRVNWAIRLRLFIIMHAVVGSVGITHAHVHGSRHRARYWMSVCVMLRVVCTVLDVGRWRMYKIQWAQGWTLEKWMARWSRFGSTQWLARRAELVRRSKLVWFDDCGSLNEMTWDATDWIERVIECPAWPLERTLPHATP